MHHLRDVKLSNPGMIGDVRNVRESTELLGIPAIRKDVMEEPLNGKLQGIAGTVCQSVVKPTGRVTTTVTAVSDLTRQSVLTSSESCPTPLQNNQETNSLGSAALQFLNHKALLQGRLVDDDLVTNKHRLLEYDSLWNPVFHLVIEGRCCIIMLDTGATCNLAFPSLLNKFPTLKLLPCGQVVNGVGGLSKPISGKLFITMSIGSQTLTCPFLFDDHQISNLDGLMGTGTLKQLLSWSVGGSPETGAFLELNGLHIRLMGYGVRNDQAVTVTLLDQGDYKFLPHISNESYMYPQVRETQTLCLLGIKSAFIPNNHQPMIVCNGMCEDKAGYQCVWSESDIAQENKEILPLNDSYDNIDANEGDLILTARVEEMENAHGALPIEKALKYTCSQCDNIIDTYEGTCACQPNTTRQPTPNLKKLYQEISTSRSSVDTSKIPKRGPEPMYSALFQNSQWQPCLTVEESDNYNDIASQPVYATQSGHLPPHCSANIIVQMEGRTKCGDYLFVPYRQSSLRE